MKKFLLAVSLLFAGLLSRSQKVHFIYLQTDDRSPFFVKMGEKVQSSTATGYVIISNLIDSTYSVGVGFPKSKEETIFRIALNHQDRGFELKNISGDLHLFDLQNFTLIRGEKPPAPPTDETTYITKTDSFTRLLSLAMKDPGLLLVAQPKIPAKEVSIGASVAIVDLPIAKAADTLLKDDLAVNHEVVQVTNRPDSAIASPVDSAVLSQDITKDAVDVILNDFVTDTLMVATDTVVLTINDKVVPAENASTVIGEKEVRSEEGFIRSEVTRRSESSTTEGFGLVFLDHTKGAIDTIRLLIPNPRYIGQIGTADTNKQEEEPVAIEVKKEQQEEKAETPKEEVAKEEVPVINKAQSAHQPKPDCTSIATDKDFLKLRKNMAAESSEEGMLDAARKTFKVMCFSSEQLRNLSVLFLTAEGKYNFFDAGYKNVIDPAQFISLQSEIRDEYYLKRFLALVGQ